MITALSFVPLIMYLPSSPPSIVTVPLLVTIPPIYAASATLKSASVSTVILVEMVLFVLIAPPVMLVVPSPLISLLLIVSGASSVAVCALRVKVPSFLTPFVTNLSA